jgi:hypothetical protein
MDEPARIDWFGRYFLFFGVDKHRYATHHFTEKVAIAVHMPDIFSFFYVSDISICIHIESMVNTLHSLTWQSRKNETGRVRNLAIAK